MLLLLRLLQLLTHFSMPMLGTHLILDIQQHPS
jgi:hypothetical protein